ncbi:MAG: inorganic phosphate transporter [Ruminococcus sp.]|nr:inorganic phosphate transporter [Ruminococcus sp.]
MNSIYEFWSQMTANPLLFLAVTLTLGVFLVNGWTDAPNAIATCVVTRCMPAKVAILMASFFNFLGVFVMTLINATVAETITKMVNFGSDLDKAIIALSAALFAIVLWATLAWVLGIPTSESHALIAGLTGSAIALHNNLEGVNGNEWIKVIYGIIISVVLGFGAGWIVCKAVKRVSAINFRVVKEMVLTWVLTFPGCGLVGFIMTKIFILLFT